jgi:hypothetical protein
MLDDNTMCHIRARVDAVRDRRWEAARFEIQDDGLFLLITIVVAVSQSGHTQVRDIFRLVGAVCGELVPERPNTYSWMIAIEKNGHVIQNAMGGWTGMAQNFPPE